MDVHIATNTEQWQPNMKPLPNMEMRKLYHQLVKTESPLSQVLREIPINADYPKYRDYIAKQRDQGFQMMVFGESGFQEGKPEIPEHLHRRLGVAWLYLDSHSKFSDIGLKLTENYFDMIRRKQGLTSA
jgi:hypothetical protein